MLENLQWKEHLTLNFNLGACGSTTTVPEGEQDYICVHQPTGGIVDTCWAIVVFNQTTEGKRKDCVAELVPMHLGEQCRWSDNKSRVIAGRSGIKNRAYGCIDEAVRKTQAMGFHIDVTNLAIFVHLGGNDMHSDVTEMLLRSRIWALEELLKKVVYNQQQS
jgi:hypothetical protein